MARIPYPQPPLVGADFILRRFETNDYPAARAAGEHSTSARWVEPLPEDSSEKLLAWIERRRRAGRILWLVIASSDDESRYLGEVLLKPKDPARAELGYLVAPDARGRELAAAAVRLASDWAFAHLGLARLEILVDPDNAASIRVAEKAGFRREGLLRSNAVFRGRRVDELIYSRLQGDPATSRQRRATKTYS